MTVDECRELSVLWQCYGVGFTEYRDVLSAADADLLLRVADGATTAPIRGVSAFAEAPVLDL